ncbi:HNH endonuclease [Nocardiopsis synnemataformans]|uniref:HNH endonuclease n=1 Tax=Nocardiopsis synnemataformans TaxID=61305 RepID=UPI003EB7FF0B
MTPEDVRLSQLYRAIISEDPCFHCGTAGAERFHVDHYVPVSLGGTDHWWNLVQAYADCNLSKYDSMPLEFIDRIRKKKTPQSPLKTEPTETTTTEATMINGNNIAQAR